MKHFVKFIFSLILPITVLLLVPSLLVSRITIPFLPSFLFGLIVMGIGLYVMILTISSFSRVGKGTLAPWSPTKKLVVAGMYRYVRNPMILGVLTVLTGESIALLSGKIFLWALVFFAINHVFFLVYEEPDLERKFGNEYRAYKENVPRWIPRSDPYKNEGPF